MAARKRTSPVRRNHLELMVEQMRADNRATLEAVLALAESTDTRFNESATRMDARFDILEAAVGRHSLMLSRLQERSDEHGRALSVLSGLPDEVASLRAEVSALSGLPAEVSSLRGDVQRLASRVETLADRTRVDDLERRVTALETTIR